MISKEKVYIIAEAGVNHNGDLNLALKLIEEAKKSGADCVKFQTFKAEQIVTKTSPKAKYQLKVTDSMETQFDMLKKLELKSNYYKPILNLCKKLNIDFLSTPVSFSDVDFLDDLDVFGFKIASAQLVELPFLEYVALKNKVIVLSTGMANLSDVYNAVSHIRKFGNNKIYVLQCTTNYPSSIEDANLLAMNNIGKSCNVDVGYSDHVKNNFACYAAVALGAKIVEKHFTLNKKMEGPDHSCSSDPKEFKQLVIGIRNIELSLGSGVKKPSKKEIQNSFGMKRSLVLISDLKKGDVIQKKHIGFKRPADGLMPNMYYEILGKKMMVNLNKDISIKLEHIKW